jgi:hypothetical protein
MQPLQNPIQPLCSTVQATKACQTQEPREWGCLKQAHKWPAVFQIRIRIHVFFGLPDPDPIVRGMDPDLALDPYTDPSIIMQK